MDKHWPGQQNVSANGYTRSLCILDVPEDDTFDHRLANATIDSLRLAKQQQRPFAIFAGHRRPHLPWRLPRKWWDLYANRDVAPPAQPAVYADAPNVGFTVSLKAVSLCSCITVINNALLSRGHNTGFKMNSISLLDCWRIVSVGTSASGCFGRRVALHRRRDRTLSRLLRLPTTAVGRHSMRHLPVHSAARTTQLSRSWMTRSGEPWQC